MHECPECGQVCYCDLDDSNDCREDDECFHDCPPDYDEEDTWPEDDDGPPPPCRHGIEWMDRCWRCELTTLPSRLWYRIQRLWWRYRDAAGGGVKP